jgi:hypothetical protein
VAVAVDEEEAEEDGDEFIFEPKSLS